MNRDHPVRFRRLLVTCAMLVLAAAAWTRLAAQESDEPEETPVTPIAEITRDEPVDFEKEILPILKQNCLACHNATDAESELVLETPQTILKGGAGGEVIDPGNGAESLLLEFAAGSLEPIMPPEDNDRGAKRLTSEELGLIKLWIDQGAKGTVSAVVETAWQPLPPGVSPIYALAMSFDAQYVACGRANQIFIYHAPTGHLVGRLTDPIFAEKGLYEKQGVAHRDLVQSLAFSPDGNTLASGGYRVVKLWNRPRNVTRFDTAAGNAPLSALAASPDGKLFASGGGDGKIRLFDAAGGQTIDVLEGHSATILGIVFSPDSARLISAGEDRTICLWDLGERRLVNRIETAAAVKDIAFGADGSQIIAAVADGVIRVWSELAAEPREFTGHEGAVTSVAAVAADANRFVSGGEDGSVRTWELSSGAEVAKYDHAGPVTAVAVRPDGARVASAGSNNVVRLWNSEDGAQLAEVKGDIDASRRLAMGTLESERDTSRFDASVAAFTAAEKDNTAKAAAAKTAAESLASAKTALPEAETAKTAAIEEQKAADARVTETAAVATAATEAQAAAEKLATSQTAISQAAEQAAAQSKVAADAAAQTAKAADDALAALKTTAEAHPEDKELAAAATAAGAFASQSKAGSENAAAVLAAAEQLKTVKAKSAAEATAAKTAADAALAEAQAAATKATEEKTAADAAAEEKTKAAAAAATNLTSAERANTQAEGDARRATELLARTTTTRDAEQSVHEATAARFQQITEQAAAMEKPVHALAFSLDGSLLAVGSESGALFTYRGDDGAALESYRGHQAPVRGVAFTPDGAPMTCSDDMTIKSWELYPSWQLTRRLGPPKDAPLQIESSSMVDRVIGLDFSPDGGFLATGGGEPSRSGEVKIYNVADGALVHDLGEPHTDTVFAVRFSPRGTYLASGSADKFVKVHKLEDGEPFRAFEGHTHHVLGVAWSGDAKRLASAGADSVIKVWNFETGEQRRTIGGFGKQVTAVEFVGNSNSALTACGDAAVRAHNTNDGKGAGNYSGASDFLYALAATPDGTLLAAGGQDSVLRLWKSGESKPLRELAPPEESPEANGE